MEGEFKEENNSKKKFSDAYKLTIGFCQFVVSAPSTFMGVYKHTDFFNNTSLYKVSPIFFEGLHWTLSVTIAGTLAWFIYHALTELIADPSSTSKKTDEEASIPFLLACIFAVSLSFSFSLIGFYEAYLNLKQETLLVDYDGSIEKFEEQKELLLYRPLQELTRRLENHVALHKKDFAELQEINGRIKDLENNPPSQSQSAVGTSPVLSESVTLEEYNRLLQHQERLINQQKAQTNMINAHTNTLKELRKRASQLQIYNNIDTLVICNNFLSSFALDRSSRDEIKSLISYYKTGKLALDTLDFHNSFNSLENSQEIIKLFETEKELLKNKSQNASLITILKSLLPGREENNNNNNQGYIILGFLLAFFGDIFPVLVALKSSKPKDIPGLIDDVANWLGTVSEKLNKVGLIPKVLRGFLGFLGFFETPSSENQQDPIKKFQTDADRFIKWYKETIYNPSIVVLEHVFHLIILLTFLLAYISLFLDTFREFVIFIIEIMKSIWTALLTSL